MLQAIACLMCGLKGPETLPRSGTASAGTFVHIPCISISTCGPPRLSDSQNITYPLLVQSWESPVQENSQTPVLGC